MAEPLNLLMATMGMDIGGAETHIVELSKALCKRGHRVTVASNGGVYVGELEAAGIRHVSIPMHRRSVPDMLKSYFALKKLIKAEGFDVVHAHARIPGFLCSLVRKTVKFPFVTTAHWVFATGGIAGRLSNWGQKTIAVSDDIKTYLMEGYGVPERDILVTINGIDMARYSPEVSGAGVRQEFGIPEGAPVITHVSRLDRGRALVAGQLIDSTAALAGRHPDLHVLIAGGGDQGEQLTARAQAVNEKLGRTVIHMAGPRTDIAAVIAAGDIFTGVSRAALEAMSGGRPVVVAGDEGYIGLFDRETLQVARDTNFCCRGCAMSTAEALTEDLDRALRLTPEQRAVQGAYNRETVGKYYSVTTMADDAERAYQAVLARTRRVLLSGYYGFNNAGDEAILAAFMQSAGDLEHEISVTVLSNAPEQTRKKYGCDAVYRFGVFSVLGAMRRCDLLVSGGGSLLQDKSSTRSIMYYLSIIRLAKWFGKPVMLYANGIGPVDRPTNRRRVKQVVARADLVTLREESSLEELGRMGVEVPGAHVTADPIFLLDALEENGAKAVLTRAGIPLDRPLAGISVRNLDVGEDFVPRMARLGDRLSRELGRTVVFIAMQIPGDVVISQQIADRMTEPAYVLGGDQSPQALIGACGLMDLVVTMRLHTMLFAAKARVPVIGLVCDPKIEYFLQNLEMPSGGTMEQFDPDRLLCQAREILEDHENYRRRLSLQVEAMEARVGENSRYLGEILDTV